jgi:hypothetical protein
MKIEWRNKKVEPVAPEPVRVENVNIGRVRSVPPLTLPPLEAKPEPEPEQPDLVTLIANNSELWYKAQVLSMLAEIIESLERLK